MSETKVKGVVHIKEDTKSYGQKGFRKRLIVLEQDNGRFTNYIPLDFIGESCDRADSLNIGDEVEVTYRLSGRKWQRDAASEVKFFLSAEAMSFRVVSERGKGPAAGLDPEAANDGFSEAAYDDEPPF